jgi:hypothetical protein
MYTTMHQPAARPEHGGDFQWHGHATRNEPSSPLLPQAETTDALAAITSQIRRVIDRNAAEIRAALETSSTGRKVSRGAE